MIHRLRIVPLLAAFLAPIAEGAPPVFDTRPYAEARQAAEGGDRWFIVKATAAWCGPCRKMDSTTWVDARLVDWIKANAIAVALDVDKEPATAKSLAISAMPTMIAFKGGKEVDRIVGYRSADEMLAWIDGLTKGRTSMDALREKAKKPAPGNKVDVSARLELARAMAMQGKFDEATDAYVWLWKNMLEHAPAMAGVRGSFMAGDMGRLAARSESAKAAFTRLRDEVGGSAADPAAPFQAFDDWLVLNEVIGDQGATLAWFDRAKGDPKWKDRLDRESFRLEAMLLQKQRWADYGAILGDPLQTLRMQHQISGLSMGDAGQLDEKTRADLQRRAQESWRESAATLYASLLAAKRTESAERVAAEAVKLDPDPAMTAALVAKALEVGVPRREQLGWLDAAMAKSPPAELDLPALKRRLEQALAAAPAATPKTPPTTAPKTTP